MVSYFARFLEYERRQKAYALAMQMNTKKLFDALPVPKYRATYNKPAVLKFCPCCVNEDRERIGETYFRVSQQIYELNFCPIHKAKLIRTDVPLDTSLTPSFIAAECVIPYNNSVIYSESDFEIKVSEYIYAIQQAPFEINRRVEVKDVLIGCDAIKPYIKYGERNMMKLTADFNHYFAALGISRELWQLQGLLLGRCRNPYEIALLGIFLGLTVEELCGLV